MIFYTLFVLGCVYFSYQDIVYGEIKRIYLLAAMISAVGMKAHTALWDSLGGAAIGILLFLLVYILSKKQLGLADVWFSGFIGAALGIVQWYAAVSIGCIAAFLFFLCSRGKWKRLPFIPFLSVGACITELIVKNIYNTAP